MVSYLRNGGTERQTVAFANMLVKLGEDVHIACVEEKPDEYFPDPKVTRHRLTYSSEVKIPKLRGLCNRLHPFSQLRKLAADVIIPFNLPLEYCMKIQLATWCSKTRFIYSVRHNQETQYTGERDRSRWKRICSLADGIWIQTQAQRSFFPQDLQKKIFEVPNLLDRSFLEISREKRAYIRRFVSMGRIHPVKNQKLLIKAFAQMLIYTKDPYATLTIYGRSKNDGLKQELKTLIREFHLEERVFLSERVLDIEKKYKEADAFVFGSDNEGFPNALMEAMAAGLPCVSTDCPTGPADLITNGTNGLLVPVGDVDAMAHAMQYLVENPQKANRMGMAAKQRMKAWANQEEIAEQLLKKIKEICC